MRQSNFESFDEFEANSTESLDAGEPYDKSATEKLLIEEVYLVDYEESLFPGELVAIKEKSTVTVKCLQRTSAPLGSSWKWPEKKIFWIILSAMLSIRLPLPH